MATYYPRRVPLQVVWGTAGGARFMSVRGPSWDRSLAPVVSLHAYEGADAATTLAGAMSWIHNATSATGREVIVVHTGPCWAADNVSAGNGIGLAAIDAALDHFGHTSGPVCLFGISMGGLNALAWAAANPDRVGAIAAFVPALSLEYIWDGFTYRASLETAWGTSGKSATMAATADVDPYRNMGDFAGFGDRTLILADTADVAVGYARQAEFAETIGARFIQSPGWGHIAWPIGVYDELDQPRTWALAP
jgi:pimeloyl-ACP methyl ester carboxylesterase